MANRLNVTELDFDAIKTNLKDFLRQQTEFQDYDFEGSGMNILMDVLAYNTHYNAYYLNMVANESFLESASLRNSVVSHAKSLGYTPRSVTAPQAVVNLTVLTGNSNSETLTLPKGFIFVCEQINNRAYTFVNLESYTVSKVGTNFTFNGVKIYEGKSLTYTYTHSTASNPKQIFTIPDAFIDTTTLVVTVKSSSGSTDTAVYSKSGTDLTINSLSEIYFLQEGIAGNYQIYFGDGVLGKKLPDGAIVTVSYLVTGYTQANGASQFRINSAIGGYTNITVSTVSSASRGADRESIDEIKFGAPLNLLSQNRAVTKNDYIRLIQQKYPSFQAVNVWGGEENDPPVYGKVYISAKPRLGFEVSDTEKEYVKTNILKPISMLTVSPEIVDVDYNYLKISSSVFYDKAKTTLADAELKANIRTVIANYCDTNLNQFNSYFKYSGLETAIDSYSRGIISNEISLFVGKKFRPSLNVSDNYTLDFGFELVRGTTNDNFYSSPTFRVPGAGTKECNFEEIPSSFTGVESITVLTGGYGYKSTPTVLINGDGTGATANAVIVNGKLSEIIVTNPGFGYTSASISIVKVSTDTGVGATAEAVLQGRYGKLRIAYYDDNSTKVIINSDIGVIDYKLGKITLTKFQPTFINNDFGDITLHMKPTINIIQSKLNKMLVLDANDPTSIIVKTTQI